MALSKKARTWLIILGIPAVLIVCAAVGAKLYFTSERLKGLIIPEIEETTHRTVSIGDISLSLFPTLAVEIDNLKISNPTGSSFDQEQFISLDNLKLKVKVLKLLLSKLEIDYVIVNHPVVYLETTKDGRKNYSTESPGAKLKTKVTVSKNNTGALLLSNLEINDGEIEQVDEKFDMHMLIKGIHQTANVEARPGENTIFVNGTSSIESFSYGSQKMWYLAGQPVTADARLSYHTDSDVLSFDACSVKIRDLPLSVSGTISHFTEPELAMNLVVNSPGAQMTQLLSIIPPEMLKKAQGLSSSGDVVFSMTVRGPSSETMSPGIEGTFTLTNGNMQYASLPKSISNINLSGSFEKPPAHVGATSGGNFGIEKLTATIGNNVLNGKLHVADFGDPHLTAIFAGKMNLNEVKDFYPLEQGTELAGTMSADISVDGKPKSPQTLKAAGTVNFQNVVIKTAGSSKPLKNLNGTVKFNNQAIESKQLAMDIGESDMILSFTLKNYLGLVMSDAAKTSGKPNATVTLTSRQLRTVDLMSEKPATKETGPKKKASSTATGAIVPGIDIDANINVSKLQTEKFTFTDAKGVVNLSDGVVNLKNLSVNAFDGMIQSKGTLDLRDPKKSPFDLNLDIKNVESNEMLSSFSSIGKYLFGKFSTTTTIKGDLNDSLGLNPQSLLGNGVVNISSGKLSGYPLTQKLADATSLVDLRDVNFKNWTNAFSISNGRLNIKDLKVSSGTTDFLANGSQGLDGSMDYNLNVKLPPSVSSQLKLGGVAAELLQFFKDKDGRYSLNFSVSGMASDPAVKLNTKAQEEVAKQAVGQKKQQLLDEGKKKAEDALKKLFKKP